MKIVPNAAASTLLESKKTITTSSRPAGNAGTRRRRISRPNNQFEGEIIDIDGIRLQNNKGWILIRASNTQNQLTCRAEALNNDDLIEMTNLIEYHLKLSGVDFKFNP